MDLFDVKSQITGTTIAEDQFKSCCKAENDKVEAIQPTLHPGKFFWFPDLGMNHLWINASFPNDTHDDMVDVLAYAIHEYFIYDTDVDVSYS
jgi:phage terminase large subunit-like protein